MPHPEEDYESWKDDPAPSEAETFLTQAVREPRYTPSWLIPGTVEGIGFSLAEAASRLTQCAAAVVVRDPITETAPVVAVSAGADRRLLGVPVAPSSAAGRACMGDVTAYGLNSEDLLGRSCAAPQRREHQGVAFSLLEGRRSVGALIVFAPPEVVDRALSEELSTLAKQAGRVLGRTVAAQVLARQGEVDEVTGQPNREGLERAMRENAWRDCALLRVTIDDADEIDPGMVNAVLRQFAALLRNATRESDVTARLGGEDFAVFLPDTVLDEAVQIANRIRVAVSESDFAVVGVPPLTCSTCVASIPDTVADVDLLVEVASRDLERAMAEGSNRVVVAGA